MNRMTRMQAGLSGLLVAATVLAAGVASGQVLGRRISYQGQIEGAAGLTTIVFRIYDSGGAPVWGPEQHILSPDAAGRFVAVIGSTELDTNGNGTPDLDEIAGSGLELEVSVGQPDGTLIPLAPRQLLFPAFHAASAESVVDGAITVEKLAPGAVTQGKLAPGAVGNLAIQDGSIITQDLANGSVTTAKLQNSSVSAAKLATNSVNTTNVVDNSLTSLDLAEGSVGASEIQTNAVGASEIAAGAVQSSEIAAGAVTNAKLNLSVTFHSSPTATGPTQVFTTIGTSKQFCALSNKSCTEDNAEGTFQFCRVTNEGGATGWVVWARATNGQQCNCTAVCF